MRMLRALLAFFSKKEGVPVGWEALQKREDGRSAKVKRVSRALHRLKIGHLNRAFWNI